MPDLAEATVADWIERVRPLADGQRWPPMIRPIEQTAGLDSGCRRLGTTLDAAAAADAAALGIALRASPLRDELAAVLAQFGAARLLRLLHWLSEGHLPEAGAALAALLRPDTEAGRALQAAAAALTRQATLNAILDPARIAALQAALAETEA